MIKTRVIPLLLLKDGLMKKPVRFRERPRTIANPISIVQVFESRQVDELILLDIGAAKSGRNVNPIIVSQAAETLTVPFTVGGGIRNLDQARKLIEAGAEKVSINTAALERPELITELSDYLGSQCTVVSIDAEKLESGKYEVFSSNARLATGRDPVTWAKEAEDRGAGEILLNAIHRDGTMEGYDLDLIGRVSAAVEIPVIAAGGAGSYQDFVDAVKMSGAHAVAAGSLYHFREVTPDKVKAALSQHNVPVRLGKPAGG